MKTCIACGMPLTKSEDCFNGDLNSESCIHCTNEDGTMKSCEVIFKGGVEFFMNATGSERELAEKLVRKNMKNLPHWKNNSDEILEGPEATDEEFMMALVKLGA